MPELPVLFVKSDKIDNMQWSMPHRDHWCSAGYRATKTELVLNEEDRKAIEVLEKAGLRYTLIDLGVAGTAARIKAKIDGVNRTPTLIYKEHELKGLQQITKMLKTIADAQQK